MRSAADPGLPLIGGHVPSLLAQHWAGFREKLTSKDEAQIEEYIAKDGQIPDALVIVMLKCWGEKMNNTSRYAKYRGKTYGALYLLPDDRTWIVSWSSTYLPQCPTSEMAAYCECRGLWESHSR